MMVPHQSLSRDSLQSGDCTENMTARPAAQASLVLVSMTTGPQGLPSHLAMMGPLHTTSMDSISY